MVLTMILPSIALAAEVTQQLGPYTVSFDMNTNMNYQVQKDEPMETPFYTGYPMLVITDNNTASRIMVTKYKNQTDSTPAMDRTVTSLTMALRGLNVTSSEDRLIDGKMGFVLIGEPFPGNEALPSPSQYAQASYWTDSEKCECGPVSLGTENVVIMSTYPQDVTQGILKSIHVEKGQPAPQ